MQFKLVAATVASLALSGVLAIPTENIAAREINAQQAEMSQLTNMNKQAADADAALHAKMGAAFKQGWETAYDVNNLDATKIPKQADFQKLKDFMLSQTQQKTGSQDPKNPDSKDLQTRDPEAEPNAQCWGCNGWDFDWNFPFGCQNWLPYWGNIDFWGNPWNYYTCFGYYSPQTFGYSWPSWGSSWYGSAGIGLGLGGSVSVGGGLNVGLGLGLHL